MISPGSRGGAGDGSSREASRAAASDSPADVSDPPAGASDPAAGVTLFVGTRKGLFRASSDRDRHRWTLEGPHLAGYEVYHAVADPRHPGSVYAAVNHMVWGSHLYRSLDGGSSWEPSPGRLAFPASTGRRVRALWHVAPGHADHPDRLYVGTDPAALFVSDDGGERWRWLPGLEEHPSRPSWQSARGGLFLHSIQPDPGEPSRLYVAVSAGGCYRSEDAGESWRPINRGIRAEHLPDPEAPAGHNPHALRLHPGHRSRLYLQGYDGVYRSDDGGDGWTEITDGLPSGFGYAVALDASDPDRCWVVPEEGSHMRCVCEARLRVYESGDGGGSWAARSEGLPQEHAYLSVLRDALCTDGLEPCGVYLGTSTGHLFGSRDGVGWTLLAGFLPTILSVTAVGSR